MALLPFRNLLILLCVAIAVIPTAPVSGTNSLLKPPKLTVYLTFDDGPYPGRTDAVLDVLAEYGVKGTFFLNGIRLARGKPIQATTQRILSEGHRIGNHLWSHMPEIMYTAKPTDKMLLDQFGTTEYHLQQALTPELWNVFNSYPRLYRSPGGSPYRLPRADVYSYNWHVTSGLNPSVKQAINNVLFGYRERSMYGVWAWGDGAIVLFHDVVAGTPDSLRAIIKNVRERGGDFGVLPRPGDSPGVVIATLGGIPPCANTPGNCTRENSYGVKAP